MRSFLLTSSFLFLAAIPPNPVLCESTAEFGCGIEIIVDSLLRAEIESKLQADPDLKWSSYSASERSVLLRGKVTTLVSRLVDFANAILAKYQFNDKQYKLFVKRIKILDASNCTFNGVDYCQTFASLLDLIKAHSYSKHDDVCLSYVLTNLEDKQGNLGKAFVASTDSAGGVCDRFRHRSRVPSGSEEIDSSRGVSLNTGAVTFRHQSRGAISWETAAVVFAHEVGHSFGSPHDYPRKCLFDRNGGNYLMHSSVVQGVTNSFQEFSSCSIANISQALAYIHQGDNSCFQQSHPPVCGNGIAEAWEECDCGETDEDCHESCCNPASAGSSRGCQLKSGAFCSPSEGPCCSFNCTFLPTSDPSRGRCEKASECRDASFCDGTKSLCPKPRGKEDGTECAAGAKLCQHGSCSQSICTKYNLQPCLLTPTSSSSSFEPSCEIHCQSSSDRSLLTPPCTPSSQLTAHFKRPLHFSGHEPCISGSGGDVGFCGPDGGCHALLLLEGVGGGQYEYTMAVVAIVVALVLILANCVLCVYCRYCRRSVVRLS